MPAPPAGTPPPLPLCALVSDLPAALYASLVLHARAALEGTALPSSPPSACDAALAVKRAMEAETGDLWHVIVGSAFGASVSHEAGCYASFRLGPTCFLAWSSLDEATLVRGTREHVPASAAEANDVAAAEGAGAAGDGGDA